LKKIKSIFYFNKQKDKSDGMRKDVVIETMKGFPQEFNLDDLIEKLVFMDKVEKGLQQVKEEKTVSHENLKDKIKKW
jgi:hypothetical protein